MNGIWKKLMLLWALSVGGFGLVLTLGAVDATSWPVKMLFAFLYPSMEAEFTPHLRFSLAVMGPVTLGWCFTLIGAVQVSNYVRPEGQKVLWFWVTLGALTWFVIDSLLSVTTGFWRNVIPNTLYITTYLIILLKSGVMKRG